MASTLVVLLAFTAVWSTCITALNHVYVTPDNGHSCPSGSICHNLSYYVSNPDAYFRSNTIVIFMNGEHQLNKEEPVTIKGVHNLRLEGRGEWKAGPEENVMLSTAVIRCTSGIGGFSFINSSSSVTIRGLTFLTCGTKRKDSKVLIYAVIFVRNVSQFEFHQNSMQGNKVGLLLLQISDCKKVQVTNSSFFDTNHSQYLNPLSAQINYTFGSSFGVANFVRISMLMVTNSNFTKCCSESTTIKTNLYSDGDFGILINQCKSVHIENLVVQLQHLNTGLMINTYFYKAKLPVRTRFKILNSRFVSNSHMQSILLLRNVFGQIHNSNFSNNFNGLSVVTLTGSRVLFTKCSISNNSNVTGLTAMNQGTVSFRGFNIIQNNSASEGAGIKLLSNSMLKVIGILCIYDNIAKNGVGGGIYNLLLNNLHIPTQYVNRYIKFGYHCTIPLGAYGLIHFSGNRAVNGGSDTYGLKLTDCFIQHPRKHLKYIPMVRTGNIFFNTPLVKYLRFNDSDPLSSMSSDPVLICFCNESNKLPNCSDRTHHTSIYPGIEIHTLIATVGYYGGTSSGAVQISVYNATLVQHHGQTETKECFFLHILLASSNHSSALVNISVNGDGQSNLSVSIIAEFMDCPPGFSKDQDSSQCECAPLLAENNVTCKLSHEPFQFLRSGNSWFAYINDSQTNCIVGVNNCPFDYCNQSAVSFDIAAPDCQCLGNRTGFLCGQCHSGLSLMLGSNRCASCSNYYLFLLPVFAVAGILLVAILMFLNLTVSVGTVNGLLFYANMIKLNEAFFFSGGSVPVTSQFISWLNLDLGIEVCLFDGLDGYWKTWLQFAFPLYLFLLMTGIIIGSHYSVRICRLCGSHAVPALATLFLMSYTKILLTVTNALSMSRLTCGNSTLTVWSVDGNIAYGNGKHLPLVLFACGVLVIGLAYPVLVLCAPLLEKYSEKCIPHRWNFVPSLKPLLDAYGGPYKDRYRFWTGVTLLLRLIVTIIFSFTSGEMAKINTSIITTTILGIFFAWSFMSAVYRNVYLSVLESVFLANLFLLSNVSNAASLFNLEILEKESTLISIVVSIICFIIIVVVHCGQKMHKKRCTHRKERNDDDDVEVQQRVPGSPPDQAYGSERGQHRFVLEFHHLPAEDMDASTPVLMEREPLLAEY